MLSGYIFEAISIIEPTRQSSQTVIYLSSWMLFLAAAAPAPPPPHPLHSCRSCIPSGRYPTRCASPDNTKQNTLRKRHETQRKKIKKEIKNQRERKQKKKKIEGIQKSKQINMNVETRSNENKNNKKQGDGNTHDE